MSLTLLDRDITRMETDAIVNAANMDLLMGGGVCGAIFRAAGPEQLSAACAPLAPIKTGEAVLTPGFALPAKFVIHTAGPIYRREQAELCRTQLRSCYLNSLSLAEEKGCKSVAFPLISGGIFGYPREEAIRVAEESIGEFLRDHDMEVFLLLREKGGGLLSPELMRRVREYLDSLLPTEEADHLVLNAMREERAAPMSASAPAMPRPSAMQPAPQKRLFHRGKAKKAPPRAEEVQDSLENLIGHLDESFSQTLLRLIDAKGRTDVDVYKRANLDRKLFSKIRTGKGYMPSKRTALALAVALELDLKETEDLLARAGFALSHSQKFDVIVEYFIINGIYDIFLINEALFQYDQPLLGGA